MTSSVRLVLLTVALSLAGCRHRPTAGRALQAFAHESAPPTPAPLTGITALGSVDSGSSVALGSIEGRTFAFVADEDAPALRVVDVAAMSEVSAVRLEGRPAQILVTEGKLLVALRDLATLAEYQARADGTLERTGSTSTAVEPLALAPAGDGSVLVVSGWGHTLERFDVSTLGRTLAVDLPREPRAVIASSDGNTAFVSHAAYGSLTTVPLSADPKVAEVDLGQPASPFLLTDVPMMPEVEFFAGGPDGKAVVRHRRPFVRPMKPARFARQGYALARVLAKSSHGDLEEKILISHASMMTGDAKVVSSGYGGGGVEGMDIPSEDFTISTLDTKSATTVTRKGTFPSCRLPRASVTAGDRLFVACFGSSTVAVYDVEKVRAARSVRVPAGPIGLAVDPIEQSLFVYSLFDATLSEIRLNGFATPEGEPRPATGRQLHFERASMLTASEQRGRRLFHASGDARISADGRACASCHPDGRDDGLVWSTPNGPRQTIFLASRIHHEEPFGWMADHDSLETHMRSTMKNLKGQGLDAEDEQALAEYLLGMPGPPHADRALALSEVEGRGHAIFESEKAGCSHCHAGPDASDHMAHDVRSAVFPDRTKDFLAPSLAYIGGTAPYFHDGRYASLEDMLDKNAEMGGAAQLSAEDKSALAAYLRTL
jgi:hypothetical protein